MRVLVTANGATGHVRPMIGLAQGLERAGLEAVIVTDVGLGDDSEIGNLQSRLLPNVNEVIGIDQVSFTRSQMSRPLAERSGAALRYFLAKSEAWLSSLLFVLAVSRARQVPSRE